MSQKLNPFFIVFALHILGFALRGNLTVHMRTHGTGATPYQCNICPKKFSDNGGLKRHLLIHQRKNQTNPAIEQILEAPIIEAPINELPLNVAINEPIFENVSTFNVNPETIQFISPAEIVGDPSQLIFKIQ